MRRKEPKEKPIRPEYLQEIIIQANGWKAEMELARQERDFVLRLLEDIAFGAPDNAREQARKALATLNYIEDKPLCQLPLPKEERLAVRCRPRLAD